MKISIYQPLAIYETGQRDNQEDSLWPLQDQVTLENRLFIVCDGMGGHEHGEVASQTVSQALGTWFQSRLIEPLSKAQLEDALYYAYAQLDEKDDGNLKKMGTTLTLLFIDSDGVTAAHIGDSRIYHIRPGKGLLYQSRDHSLVYELYQSGEITYEEMLTYPNKNIITRAMQPGKDNRTHPDVIHITDIEAGDYFYLCSDGMLEQMDNNELYEIFSSNKSDEEIQQLLIEATKKNQDNHTAWIIHIKDVIKEPQDELLENEEPTARCNALNIKPLTETTIPDTIKKDESVIDAKPNIAPPVPRFIEENRNSIPRRPLLLKNNRLIYYIIIGILNILGIILIVAVILYVLYTIIF